VRDLARHQKLQRVLRSCIIAEIDQPFVDDLCARFRCDVAAQVDVELSGDFEVRVEKIDAAAAGMAMRGSTSAA